jgi:type II secretory pathway component PulF
MMPRFEYTAMAYDGEMITRKVHAVNREEVKTYLRKQGLFPCEIRDILEVPVQEAPKKKKTWFEWLFGGKNA